MSERFPGGFITNNPTAPTTTSAPGIWTLDQATQYIKAGTWPYGGPFNYIEDVFSTYLYTPASSNINVNVPNGVDLSTYGGMTWIKNRGLGTSSAYHCLVDTVRGGTNVLHSNLTTAAYTANIVSSFNTNGFTTGDSTFVSNGGYSFASWTFRKQAKFFDVVTFNQNGGVTVNHNLGSVPACIIIKSTSAVDNWYVYHTSLNAPNGNGPRYNYLTLNSTANALNAGGIWINNITSTSFDITNQVVPPFATYVAYIFASNAGGFGSSNADNVISCGSFTAPSSGSTTVTLGYEPQWVLFKDATSATNWYVVDSMRGMTANGDNARLFPNLSSNESPGSGLLSPTATGFTFPSGFFSGGDNIIYIAIRRGPMKTPTSGTSVFSPITYAGNSTASRVISGLINAPDWVLFSSRDAAGQANHITGSRLQGGGRYLLTESTSSETSSTAYGVQTYGQTSVTLGTATTNEQNASGFNYILYGLGRAPGFFDVVCYTGTGASSQTYNHNLGVTPELMIVKCRNTSATDWAVYNSTIGATNYLWLNTTDQSQAFSTIWNNTAPTSSVFTVGSNGQTGASGRTYVAYLFASVAGVSKVGSYSGTGATQTISCGFAARFVLIKRTDSTGNWVVWDTARGMVAGTDPRLELNTTNAETNANWVYTDASGFQIVTTDATVNASGGTYIFLAIA